jgi:hypothetical protein
MSAIALALHLLAALLTGVALGLIVFFWKDKP